MDCKTARLLLDFARPQARELEPEEAGALESHLDRCPDCHGLARGERQLDERLGKAMRQVEVPAGLRDQLLGRLESDRGDWYRRRFGSGLRWAAAVAAVILAGWGLWRWAGGWKTPIDLQQVADAYNNDRMRDRREMVADSLRRMGVDAAPSEFLNYDLLTEAPSSTDLPGHPGQIVPMLVFDLSGPPHRHAVVYIVESARLKEGVLIPPRDGTYKLEVLPHEGEPYAYLVVHNGENLNWLRLPERPAT